MLVGAGALTGGWRVGVFELVARELAADDRGDSSLGNTGFWSLSDAIELACTPAVLCTSPVGGSGVADAFADDELPIAVDDVDETVVNDGDFSPDGEVEEGPDGLFLSVDEEADAVDEPEDEVLDVVELGSDGSASATPGMVATAEPTPSAIANAPTRPTYLT